eukprot:CAMPEP_0198333138 /NCGR_PEP_ID=MMETSP1450-20131203/18756_1 /TAXON_ID=753684 ORGANISM="Madagascaria erythrocladiodes, Strain CCMP3234" /NCGR_SAMPLE_ID=MMETSP1450 /ASSEMBLY_ACC=CAM_ASM_001115 /LENGTH=365 /DNA_ID=CAMNT_0044037643 /DNA_START=83 /DNA_END=1180 /DNA_ORIENTATION=-
MGVEGITAAVTGASGFVGRRLVEMLLERGAARVVALDIAPWSPDDKQPGDSRIQFIRCDLGEKDKLISAFTGVDCVWHMAALVGPFHARDKYLEVNYHGTLNVIEACRQTKVPKLIASSSPSTRFHGNSISGLREDQMTICPPGKFMEPYAETKAMGEQAVAEACCDSLMTVNIAPHQVYGPNDPIFLPNLMDAMRTGKLRIFGNGQNEISVCYNDNYCHGLILGYDALFLGSPALGNFYIITDGGKVKFWEILNDAGVKLGYTSLYSKASLPVWLLMIVAHLGLLVGRVTGKSFKLTPFVVKMLIIDRWFSIERAQAHLGYEPIYDFDTAWNKTIDWFKDNREFLERCATKTSKNKVFTKSKNV